MRILDIADGFQSNSNPVVSALTARKLVQYISDGAYVTANGSPTGGEIYYNTTSGEVRVYDSTTLTWKTIGQTIIGKQETPAGSVDGLNVNFTISLSPINADALCVYIDGLLETKNNYSYSTGTITFNVAPSLGQKIAVFYLTDGTSPLPSPSLDGQYVEYRILSGAEISAKKIVLASTPAEPTKVLLDWVSVTTQVYGTDYDVSGNELSWAGKGLDGYLIAGDTLRVVYLIF